MYRDEATKGLYLTPKRKEKALAANGHTVLNGKAIGEFICDRVHDIYEPYLTWLEEQSCVDMNEIAAYKGDRDCIYGLHITAPKLYDKPKELSRFYASLPDKILDSGDYDCRLPGDLLCIDAPEGGDRCWKCSYGGRKVVSRPPQSWQYIIDPEVAE